MPFSPSLQNQPNQIVRGLPLSAFLHLRHPGAAVPSGVAALALHHLWDQHRIGDRGGRGLPAGPGAGRLCRRMGGEPLAHPAPHHLRGHRVRDRPVRFRVAADLRLGRPTLHGGQHGPDRDRRLRASGAANAADGRDAADPRRLPGRAPRPRRQRRGHPLFCKYAGVRLRLRPRGGVPDGSFGPTRHHCRRRDPEFCGRWRGHHPRMHAAEQRGCRQAGEARRPRAESAPSS